MLPAKQLSRTSVPVPMLPLERFDYYSLAYKDSDWRGIFLVLWCMIILLFNAPCSLQDLCPWIKDLKEEKIHLNDTMPWSKTHTSSTIFLMLLQQSWLPSGWTDIAGASRVMLWYSATHCSTSATIFEVQCWLARSWTDIAGAHPATPPSFLQALLLS